jgi:hypothetical protein
MEWYCCALIIKNKNNKKNFIIHAGLFHTDNIIQDLITYYNYKKVNESGINKMDQINEYYTGCIQLPQDIEKHTGGSGNCSFGFY